MRSPAAATAAFGVTLVLAAATACTTAAPSASPPGTTPATSTVMPSTTATTKGAAPSTIYANDPAKPVTASVGETVALRVDTDPSSDAGWEVASFDEGKLFDLGATYDDSTSVVPGRAVTQNLLFRATAPGTATVVLRYGVPGAPGPTDTRVTFTITIS